MILGIGTDIIEVSRIKRNIDKNPRFVEKNFTDAEVAYCNAKANPGQSFAARFAAKEAVMKAFGTGWDGNVNWRDIEIVVNEKGKPEVVLHGGALELFCHHEACTIQISLSHERDFAVAFALWES